METKQSSTFRILSIDGGGVRGIIPARILQGIEEAAGKPIHQLFDLIVGTSTGGLIALGLTCPNPKATAKYSAKEILSIYMNSSAKIFERSFLRTLFTGGGLWGAKYDRASYDTILNNLFGNTFLSQALCPVVIPTYSLTTGSPNLYSSRLSNNHSSNTEANYYMRDIAGATSSAPTYFPPKTFKDTLGNTHIDADGGIFANNPETIGVTEAYELSPDLQRKDIRIVSIGTGCPRLAQPAGKLTNAGVIGWVMKANLIDIMMDADSDWYNHEISALYPSSIRLQAPLPDALGEMDNTSSENLQGLLGVAESFLKNNTTLIQKVIEQTGSTA